MFRKEVGCDDLQCKKEVRSNVRNTGKKCGNDEGYFKEIGYQITTNEWVTLIEICYDDDRGATLYTKHDLIGNEIARKLTFYENVFVIFYKDLSSRCS